MKKIITFLLGVTFVAALSLNATTAAAANDEAEKHPIDAALEKKIDADSSTAGMIAASQWAEKEWDKLLNANYKALMKKLDKKSQEKLRNSQREWVKFRDLEFEFNGNFYGGFDGTMYLVFPAGFRANFVRERALRLGAYLEQVSAK